MEATEIRRQRLKQWLEDEFEGRVAALCRYYELPPATASYLSQLLSGYRVFGERAARKLEAQCNRPAGWLDTDPQSLDQEVLRFDSKRCAKLRPEDRELIEDFIAMVLERNDRRSVKRFTEVQVKSASVPPIKAAAPKLEKRTFHEKSDARRKRRIAA